MGKGRKGAEPMDRYLGLWVTRTMDENLRREARARGLGLSEYVRLALSGRRLPKARASRLAGPDVRAELEALARAGNNLNQIARALNSGREPDDAMAGAAARAMAECEAAASAMRRLAGEGRGGRP